MCQNSLKNKMNKVRNVLKSRLFLLIILIHILEHFMALSGA